jgi:hypothetical protein
MRTPVLVLLLAISFTAVACAGDAADPGGGADDDAVGDPDDGGAGDVAPGPDAGATPSACGTGAVAIAFPTWIVGAFEESAADGWRAEFTACDLVLTRREAGVEKERMAFAELNTAGRVTSFEVTVDDGQAFNYVAFVDPGEAWFDDSFVLDADTDILLFSRNGAFQDVAMPRAP